MIRFNITILGCLLSLTLVACGGGKSSSGEGRSFAGTYSGTGNFTLTGPGGSPSSPFSIVVVINPDNTVVLDPNSAIPGRGTISGNNITASYPAAFANSPGFVCNGKIDVSGPVENNAIKGAIGPSTFRCNNVSLQIRGRFTATLVTNALHRGSSMADDVGNVIRQAMEP